VTDKSLIYARLQRGGGTQLLRYVFLRGQGGPILLVWSLGLGLFVLLLGLPVYGVVWTAASAGLAGLMLRSYSKSRAVRGAVLRALVGRRFPASELADDDLRAGLRRTIDFRVEIALKTAEIETLRGQDSDLRGVLVDADAMLALQFESSRQADEFARALRLIDRAGGEAQDRPAGEAVGPSKLHEENLAAIRRESAAARSLALEIVQQIETLMLQVFQMERRASDIVRSAEVARETEAALERMQRQVNARRAAATEVLELLMPGARGSAATT
jgi:hypothetical protein